jgi:hypothetical protein
MKYVLMENRQTVLLGPIDWRHRFIQSELDDLEIEYSVPPVEQGYLQITPEVEIFPISESYMPAIDSRYEDPVGPSWNINPDLTAVETYTKQDKSLVAVRQALKDIVSRQRYDREIAGTTATVNSQSITLSTTRGDDRTQWNNLLATIGTGTVNWKFSNGFVELNRTDVEIILAAIATHVQAAFDWEKSQQDAIDIAEDMAALKAIGVALDESEMQRVIALTPGSN